MTLTLTARSKEEFIVTLWSYYKKHARRDLPWRMSEPNGTFDPYKILLSEIMLQQTQVSRVVQKYTQFLRDFPTVESVARATLGDVVVAWQGLGYNRRAKFLWQSAQYITAHGWPEDLTVLPGVGVNTAAAIRVYTWNKPVLFVETNIRTVYIHHFARDGQRVSDDFIRDTVAQTLDRARPREFFWALMDYGAYLKSQVHNLSQSAHYSRQSRFMGSKRQVRGAVLKVLITGPQTVQSLQTHINDNRLDVVLHELITEGFIKKTGRKLQLA